jgi:ornithine decarboxylase
MMGWMKEIYPDMGFDCASLREIHDVLPLTTPTSIIYAQPCKKREDIVLAQKLGIPVTVVDSVEEVEKLEGWEGEVLVRLLVSDKGSKQPFGKKFGAPLAWLPRIYDAAKATKLNMTGFSFHVGSECQEPTQYAQAIADCRKAQESAKQYGFHTSMVDIGGGFLSEETPFVAVADQIRVAQQEHFPDPAIRWIAEPGRFLAAPTHTLYTTVIGKKPVWPEPQNDKEPAWRITIDESVYGSFSNIPFDHQKPVLERLRVPKSIEKKRPTIVFGRTCDSGDYLGDVPLYDVEEGDVIKITNMGAYTTVTASEFNGFPKPKAIYELTV